MKSLFIPTTLLQHILRSIARNNTIFVVLICLIVSCKAERPIQDSSENPSTILENQPARDTVFLIKREFPNNPTYYHHVYASREPKRYELLSSRFEKLNNETILGAPPVATHTVKRLDFQDLPTYWTEVVYHNQSYYLQYPSDFCFLDQRVLTDSTLIHFSCEGSHTESIRTIKKLDSGGYQLFTGNASTVQHVITMIDSMSGIAVWRSPNTTKLFANVTKLRQLPIAVADCNGNKCPSELQSQSSDYRILKSY